MGTQVTHCLGQYQTDQTHAGNETLMSVLVTKPWPRYSDANVVSTLIEMKFTLW